MTAAQQRKPSRTAFEQITDRSEAAPVAALATADASALPLYRPSLAQAPSADSASSSGSGQSSGQGGGRSPAAATSGGSAVGAIQFALGSAKLSREARATIDQLAERMKSSGDAMLVIGHTCAIGSDDYNMKLSVRRAKAVRDRLAKAGVAADRLAIEGDGERQLLSGIDEADPRNRRVDIKMRG
jgi:OOP family OmpA-OmpF porin